MAENLPPVPFRAQVLDSLGRFTPVWADWFKILFNRVGGHISSTNDEIVDRFPVVTADITNEAVTFAKMLGTDWTKDTSTSGYTKLPNGLYLQWGVTASLNSDTTTSVSLPATFPNACLQVLICPQANSASSTTATGHWGTGNYSTAAFDLYNRTSISLTFNYFAMGY